MRTVASSIHIQKLLDFITILLAILFYIIAKLRF
jgi:hypothetical protein